MVVYIDFMLIHLDFAFLFVFFFRTVAETFRRSLESRCMPSCATTVSHPSSNPSKTRSVCVSSLSPTSSPSSSSTRSSRRRHSTPLVVICSNCTRTTFRISRGSPWRFICSCSPCLRFRRISRWLRSRWGITWLILSRLSWAVRLLFHTLILTYHLIQ